MNNTLLSRLAIPTIVATVLALATACAFAQNHPWAGRPLDSLEWSIHDRLAALPSHGVFDTVRFEVQGKTVTLSGQVLRESFRQNAERAVAKLPGVEKVVNTIEILPSSRVDDALRMNVYRAIYEDPSLDKYGTRGTPPIHILVKNGWVSLEGVVDSDSDRGLVLSRALRATSHVSDNLRVAPQKL